MVTKALDTFFVPEYSLNIKSISSNNSLLAPHFGFKEINVFNSNQLEILSIPNITFGINIFQSLSTGNIYLSILEIDSFKTQVGSSINQAKPIIIRGRRLKVNNDNLQISSSYFEINVTNLHSTIEFKDGFINSYPYTNIHALIDSKSNNIFYSSKHFFNEASLQNANIFDLSSFKENKISLNLNTKGIYNFETKNSQRFDRLSFNNSMLENTSGFKTKNINATLFSAMDKSIHGLFRANIPDQQIEGSISFSQKDDLKIRSNISIDLSKIVPKNQYLSLSGEENFQIVMTVKKSRTSMDLFTNLINTSIESSLKDLYKPINEILKTSIQIEDMSKISYLIKNKKIHSYIDKNNNGFFALGKSFETDLKTDKFNDGFYIYLNLNELNLDDIFYTQSDNSGGMTLREIKIKTKKFNFLNNLYTDQLVNILFKDEIEAKLFGKDLNGTINIDKTNFIKINLSKTKFNFKGLDIAKSEFASDLNNINLRFIGKDIQTGDELFQDIDFYLLKNKNILTIDDIKIDSRRFTIGPNADNEKAYISYNNVNDLYKLRGSYKLDNSSGYFNNIFNYDFDLLETNLNIQWNSLSSLVNLEGELSFLIKDLNINREIPDSTLLRALKILNLNAIVDGLDESPDSSLFISRAAGNMIISKTRALISSPIKIETTEASMRWVGEILKNNKGELNDLNLDLAMRLKISENIPWYAAIFGGIPALAGGVVLENIFENVIEDASTINFKMQGTIEEPDLVRLN
ncbi:AsmA-like C-terminal region-containing protein [Gammaproteobacteria bacterium]|nr:AsmA-like C-terminal region-containing protein [Gammaproteobacteria bacterium]